MSFRMFTLLVLGLSGLTVQVSAQNAGRIPAAADTTAGRPQQQPTTASPVDDGAVRLLLDKIEIEGRLEKPQAVFIIPGRNPEIDDINIERSFFNEIFRSVEKKNLTESKQTPAAKDRKDVIPW